MVKSSLTGRIADAAKKEGAALVGFAPAERFSKLPVQCGNRPGDVLRGARYVVSFAVQMPDACMERACFHDYGDPEAGFVNVLVSLRLNLIAARVAETLEREGHTAAPIAATVVWRYRPYKNVPTPFQGDISHRHTAAGAGLGEFGWNGLLLTPEYGPRVRLGTVITTAELDPSPLYSGPKLCDKCMRCVRECGKNIQGLTKEVNGKVDLEIGGKRFEYANKNLWRCAWTENFALKFDAPKPPLISEESMTEVFRDIAKNKLDWWRTWTVEPCWGHCLPPDIRYDDPDYCAVPRRKKKNTCAGLSAGELADKVRSEIKAAVSARLHDSAVRVIDLRDRPDLLEKLKYFLPDVKSLILVSERVPAAFDDILGHLWHDVIGVELDIITRLDRLGFSALQLSFLRDRGDQTLFREILDSAGFGAPPETAGLNDQKLYERVLTRSVFAEDSGHRVAAAACSAELPGISFEVKNTESLRTDTPETLAAAIKERARELGADFAGIASGARMEELWRQLDKIFGGEIRIEAEDLNPGKGPFIPKVEEREVKVRPLSSYLKGAKSVVVIGKKLSAGLIDQGRGAPSEAIGSYATHRTFSLELLADKALRLSRELSNSGVAAAPVRDLFGLASKFPYPIRESNTDTLASRFAAAAAGLGELGMHGMVLTPESGVRQIFMCVVVDAEIPADPLYSGPPLCKKCGACVSACPVRAIEAQKTVSVSVEGKTFSFGGLRRGHCDWAKRYSLSGGEGPRLIGSTTDIEPPELITKESLADALSKTDEIQKDYFVVMEPCLTVCKAHQRED
jgi:epoxyqueuosine reductase QueG